MLLFLFYKICFSNRYVREHLTLKPVVLSFLFSYDQCLKSVPYLPFQTRNNVFVLYLVLNQTKAIVGDRFRFKFFFPVKSMKPAMSLLLAGIS